MATRAPFCPSINSSALRCNSVSMDKVRSSPLLDGIRSTTCVIWPMLLMNTFCCPLSPPSIES